MQHAKMLLSGKKHTVHRHKVFFCFIVEEFHVISFLDVEFPWSVVCSSEGSKTQ